MISGKNKKSYQAGDKLVRTQKFPEKIHFLPPETDMDVSVTGGKKYDFS